MVSYNAGGRRGAATCVGVSHCCEWDGICCIICEVCCTIGGACCIRSPCRPCHESLLAYTFGKLLCSEGFNSLLGVLTASTRLLNVDSGSEVAAILAGRKRGNISASMAPSGPQG